MSREALFLDRDGVLNEPVFDPHTGTAESPLRIEDVRLTPTATAAVRAANRVGIPVVVVSNQPSAAKGLLTVDDLFAVHQSVIDLLAAEGALVERSYLCVHHPAGTVEDLTLTCDCRKPGPGLLRQAAMELDLNLASSWMIGDTDADVGAARAAGLAGVVLIPHPATAHRRTEASAHADLTASDVEDAAKSILARL